MIEPRVTVRQEVYEIDGAETSAPIPVIRVESHWNISGWVVLTVDEHRYTVNARDLADAVERARGR